MDYNLTLSKATALAAQLEVERAIELMQKLLQNYPYQLELIERIYKLSARLPSSNQYNKICNHIFNLKSNKPSINQLIIQSFVDCFMALQQSCERELLQLSHLSQAQLFNLGFHLSKDKTYDQRILSGLDKIVSIIKQYYAEDKNTPQQLHDYSQYLLQQGKITAATNELKYLSAFYAETESGRWALMTLKQLKQ
jgi:tetratricopeptide (TPR) repeat protein